MSALKAWLWNVLVAIDQFVNVLLSPVFNAALRPVARFGFPDETLSSVFAKNAKAGCKVCRIVCRVINFFDPGHCEANIEHDEGDR